MASPSEFNGGGGNTVDVCEFFFPTNTQTPLAVVVLQGCDVSISGGAGLRSIAERTTWFSLVCPGSHSSPGFCKGLSGAADMLMYFFVNVSSVGKEAAMVGVHVSETGVVSVYYW